MPPADPFLYDGRGTPYRLTVREAAFGAASVAVTVPEENAPEVTREDGSRGRDTLKATFPELDAVSAEASRQIGRRLVATLASQYDLEAVYWLREVATLSPASLVGAFAPSPPANRGPGARSVMKLLVVLFAVFFVACGSEHAPDSSFSSGAEPHGGDAGSAGAGGESDNGAPGLRSGGAAGAAGQSAGTAGATDGAPPGAGGAPAGGAAGAAGTGAAAGAPGLAGAAGAAGGGGVDASACLALVCREAAADCGETTRDCNGTVVTVDCGGCPDDKACGGSGVPNRCGDLCRSTDDWLTYCRQATPGGFSFWGMRGDCSSTPYRREYDQITWRAAGREGCVSVPTGAGLAVCCPP